VKDSHTYRIQPDQIITYSLRGSDSNSDRYYEIIRNFADEVIDRGRNVLETYREEQELYLSVQDVLVPVTQEESIFTLLIFGVLWKVYGEPLEGRDSFFPGSTLHATGFGTNDQQDSQPIGIIKQARRILSVPVRLSLRGERQRGIGFDAWLERLEETGELSGEVRRLTILCDLLRRLIPTRRRNLLGKIAQFALWFEARSLAVLGEFTPNVEKYLADVQGRKDTCDDAFFCGRQRVEYHLYMVGTELLNRAYRQAFLATDRKVILLPPCMKIQPASNCKAERHGTSTRCAGCTPACRIHHVSSLCRKLGSEAVILEGDLTTFTQHMVQNIREINAGVIGVSCVLTNAPGGFAARDAGIDAQGVLLDYCGCWWHWHEDGIPTDLNLRQLASVLGEE
jgi:hypothetical protein